jgi:hypothetical protein
VSLEKLAEGPALSPGLLRFAQVIEAAFRRPAAAWAQGCMAASRQPQGVDPKNISKLLNNNGKFFMILRWPFHAPVRPPG